MNGYYIYFIHFELGKVNGAHKSSISPRTRDTYIHRCVFSMFLQVTQTGEWNAIVMSVIASWWYQDSIFPWRLLLQVCEGLRGEESMKGGLFWRERSAGFVNSTQSWTAENRRTKRQTCSLARWHWRHTCLEGLSIEANMPESQTKRRQLRDTDVQVWCERVTETSICHFKSSLSANVDMSDPQSTFYTACTMCTGRQEGGNRQEH